jgi:ribose transport system substrate-binding protein
VSGQARRRDKKISKFRKSIEYSWEERKMYKSPPFRLVRSLAFVSAFLAAPAAHAENKTYHIALSNSYIGNQWRVQMVNILNAYVQKAYKDKVKLTVVSSGTDVQAQIAAIDDMISQKVDASLIDPASASALNPVIEEATKQGIVVVDFDQAVTAPSAYKVGVDLVEFGGIAAQWMADTLKGKGDLLVVRGIAGFSADAAEYKGETQVLAKYPDLHIVAEVYGKWDDSVTQAEVMKVLPAHPKIDGIINQSDEGPALALLALHRPFVPMTGESSNGLRLAMLKYQDQGLTAISCGSSPTLGAYALKVAVDTLEGHGPTSKDINVPIPCVKSDEIKAGVNAFPDLPPTIFDDIEIPNSGMQPVTMQESLGK